MQFPFSTYGFPSVYAESLSFISHETHDSDSTLVDVQNGGVGGVGSAGEEGVHMDPFLSAASVLTSFDQGGSLWEAGMGVQSFESDPAFLAGCGAVGQASVGGNIWDGGDGTVKSGEWGAGDGANHEGWDVGDAGLLGFDAFGRGNK